MLGELHQSPSIPSILLSMFLQQSTSKKNTVMIVLSQKTNCKHKIHTHTHSLCQIPHLQMTDGSSSRHIKRCSSLAGAQGQKKNENVKENIKYWMDWKSTSQIFSNLLELLPGHQAEKHLNPFRQTEIYTRIYVCVHIYKLGSSHKLHQHSLLMGNYKRKKSQSY